MGDLFVKLYKETTDENMKTKLKEIFKIDDKKIEELKLNVAATTQAKATEAAKKESQVNLVENKRDIEEKTSTKTEKPTAKPTEKPTENHGNGDDHEVMATVEGNQNIPAQSGENGHHHGAGDELEVHEKEAEGILLPDHKNEDDTHN